MAQKTIFEIDLLAVAKQRTHATMVALSMVVLFIAWIFTAISMGNNTELLAFLGIALWILYFGLVIWAVVAMVLLQVACGSGLFTIIIFALVTPFVAFLAMIAGISQATTILRLAGAKVGFLGVSQSERAKITPGHCRKCGYDRTGLELLQECPECQRVPQVI